MSFSLRLSALYRRNHFHVTEYSDFLLVGFKPATVSFIVKEIANALPLDKAGAEALYAELQAVGKSYGCRQFRVVAYGGYLPEALAFELHGLTVCDGRYVESLVSRHHIELFPHNEAAYRAIEAGFRKHRIGAVVQATGTGKSFLIARYIVSHSKERILVIAPNRTILEEIRQAVSGRCERGDAGRKKHPINRPDECGGKSGVQTEDKLKENNPTEENPVPNDSEENSRMANNPAEVSCAGPEIVSRVNYRTFQSLTRWRGRGAPLQADHILIDEFHHSGAEVWGEALRDVIEANPSARVLGTSATPVRPEGMVDTVDVYFEGNLFYELTLPEAWHYGILPVPLLVQSVYGLDGRLDQLQRLLDRSDCTAVRRCRIQQQLDAARVDFTSSLGAAALIRQFLPPTVRKLLVFCRDKADLRQMIPQVMGWLAEAGRDAVSFEVHNDQRERENRRVLRAFRKESEKLHVLFSINMLIEGLHVEGVDAALFLRRTESYVVTLQQLGRCLKAGSERRPVILDFVNNLSGKSVYDVLACDLERMSAIRSPHGFEGVCDFQVTGFFSDIQQRVREILTELEPWQLMYERLQEYRSTENDWPSATEGKLGLWCHTQRMAQKRGSLLPERRARLEALGFEWEQQDSIWSQQYENLKVFYAREGRWPRRGEGSLAIWCNTQRQMRKRRRLTKERIRRLDAIGFVWAYDLDKEWEKQYETLRVFHTTHQRFPKASEGCLGSWCVTQRKLKRLGELAEERAAQLDALGFPWTSDSVWTEHFNRLLVFRASEGRWPKSREGALGNWCSVQRRLFKKGELNPDRVEKLEKAGFPLK